MIANPIFASYRISNSLIDKCYLTNPFEFCFCCAIIVCCAIKYFDIFGYHGTHVHSMPIRLAQVDRELNGLEPRYRTDFDMLVLLPVMRFSKRYQMPPSARIGG